MTDKQRYKAKPAIGADEEAEAVLDNLPRKRPSSPNAFVSIDAAGRLVILLAGGGALSLNERDLNKVHGDEIYEG